MPEETEVCQRRRKGSSNLKDYSGHFEICMKIGWSNDLFVLSYQFQNGHPLYDDSDRSQQRENSKSMFVVHPSS